MNSLIWKLLRRHVSIGQLAGFFLANLVGMAIVLSGVQFYRDVIPVFTRGDSFMKRDYLITTKRVSTLGGLTGKSNTFSKREIEAMASQPFAGSVGAFTPSLFKVSAGMGMSGINLSTELFFESVPDEYVDVSSDKWHYEEGSQTIPIIIPRTYLNLYNFGFAQSRSLPKLSEGVMSMIQMDIRIRGNGASDHFKGTIVGFSNRLNTILVPQSFMDWANSTYAPGKQAAPSRLIVEVKNLTDTAITDYYRRHNYETEGEGLDAGKTTYFLRMVTGIIMGVGLVISILSFYILMLSIFLLLQKNTVKLENLLLLGHTPSQVALPYTLLTVGVNLVVLVLSFVAVFWIRGQYLDLLQTLFPQMEKGTVLPCLVTGAALFLIVSLLNVTAIRRKVLAIWKGEATRADLQ